MTRSSELGKERHKNVSTGAGGILILCKLLEEIFIGARLLIDFLP